MDWVSRNYGGSKLRGVLARSVLAWGSISLAIAGGDLATADELDAARALERLYQSIASQVLPSVVQVLPSYGDTRSGDPGDDLLDEFNHYFKPDGTPRNRGLGSGFVVDKQGTTVTSAHVVTGANAVYVRLADGSVHDALVIGLDEETDIAVLQTKPNLVPPLRWGDSSGLRVGSIVLAAGHPFGLRNSLSQGIVSGLGRPAPQGQPVGYIQTDALIRPGNSGGPLLDLDGSVVGINAWLLAARGSTGSGFAIPSNLAREVVERIQGALDSGSAGQASAWLGLVLQPEVQSANGVTLLHVFPNEPADRAGLRAGDVLVSFDGRPVESQTMLEAMLGNLRPGQNIPVVVEGRKKKFTIAVGKRPSKYPVGWRQTSNADQTPERPLTATERTTLHAALVGEDCPCPCGRALYDCFGCSAAKADFSDAEMFVRAGRNAPEIRRLLHAPVMAWAWVDYTDPEGGELFRVLDRLTKTYAPLFRVRRRYFPADLGRSDLWRRSVNALEIARAAHRYQAAQRYCLEENTTSWDEKLEQMPIVLGLDRADFEQGLAENRYQRQIEKDLLAAPTQYGVHGSPALQFGGKTFTGLGLDFARISSAVEQAILESSF